MAIPYNRLRPMAVIAFLFLPLTVTAQSDVEVTIFVDPYPSPYLSDWELQSGIISLTVTNGSVEQDLVITITIQEPGGRSIVEARGDPQPYAAYESIIYSSGSDVGGALDYDSSYLDNILRTGRLPEGEFLFCVQVEDAFGSELAPTQCEPFSILFPDPPYLMSPNDADIIRTPNPLFQWTPLQVPPNFEVRFVLQIAEILVGQTPYEALTSNILHFENDDITFESFDYSIDAAPLEEGKSYAWWVLALDDEGLAMTSNDGRSEIWTFNYISDEIELFPAGDTMSLRLVAADQASGPLSEFDNSTFEEVVEQLQLLTAAGSAIELPLALEADFPPIEVGGISLYLDTQRKSLAIRGEIIKWGNTYDVMFSAYWGSRHDPRSKALSIKGPKFDGFFQAEGLLDDLATNTAFFIASCGNYTLKSSELPPEVGDYFGDLEIGVSLGLNFFANVEVRESHWLATVASTMNIEQEYLHLQGYFGPKVGVVFGSADGAKVEMGLETALSAAIPLWTPARFQGVISNMEGKLELGGGIKKEIPAGDDSTSTVLTVGAQLSLEAAVTFPGLVNSQNLNNEITLTGALKVEKSSGEEVNMELSLSADDIMKMPVFEDVFSIHDPTLTATFVFDEQHTHKLAFSAKCDVGRYNNFGSIKIERIRSASNTSEPDSTVEDTETPPPGGVPTPFKQAELLAKQEERKSAARRKPKTSWEGKWGATITVDPLALAAIRPRELLMDLFNFAGNLDLLPDGPELHSLNMRFLPEVPGSMMVAGSFLLGNSPTYFIGSRVRSMDGGTGMLFGIAPQNWSFQENFPDLNIPLVSEMEISNVGLLFATDEFMTSSDDLFGEEYGFYQSLYQQDEFMVDIKPGVNLIASLPVEEMDPNSPLIPLMDKLGAQRGPALLHGAIGNRIEDLYFRVSLPPLSPPDAPEWFEYGQLDLEITGQPSLGLTGSMAVNLDEDLVIFFVKTKAGREGLILAGGMDAPGGWVGPFGIDWMTINRTVLLLGLTPTGSIQMGFEGDLVIGESDIRVAVLAALNAATGVPTNFMFDGESEAGLAVADLVDMQARIVASTTGGEPQLIPMDKLPLLGVEDLKLKFAPKDSPELNIDRGMAIGGMLNMQPAPNEPADLIAAAEFDISEEGVIARAAVGDFAIGPVSLTDAAIDLTLTREEQYFRMSGEADLTIMQASIEVDFARTEMSFDAEGKAFALFMADIHAVGKANLSDPQFTVKGTLKNDFNSAVAGELITAALANSNEEVRRAKRQRDAAVSNHNKAVRTRNRARSAWLRTPAFPRNKKVAARNRYRSASRKAFIQLARRSYGATLYTKWLAVQTTLVAAEAASGAESPLKIRSARFDGDLSRIKDGQVAKLNIVAEIEGKEISLSNEGFNFRDMGPGLKQMARQIVQQMFKGRQ